MRLLRAGAIAAAFAAVLAAGALIAALTATASPRAETYTGRTGDGKPDITSVTVSHDDNGTVTLSLTALGMGTPVVQDTMRSLSAFVEPDDGSSPAAARSPE